MHIMNTQKTQQKNDHRGLTAMPDDENGAPGQAGYEASKPDKKAAEMQTGQEEERRIQEQATSSSARPTARKGGTRTKEERRAIRNARIRNHPGLKQAPAPAGDASQKNGEEDIQGETARMSPAAEWEQAQPYPPLPAARMAGDVMLLRMEVLTPPDPGQDGRWTYEHVNNLHLRRDGAVYTCKGTPTRDCAAFLVYPCTPDTGPGTEAIIVVTDVRTALSIAETAMATAAKVAVCIVTGAWALRPVVNRLRGAFPDMIIGLVVRPDERGEARRCAMSKRTGLKVLPDKGLPAARKHIAAIISACQHPGEGDAARLEISANDGCLETALPLAAQALAEQGRVYQRASGDGIGLLVCIDHTKGDTAIGRRRNGKAGRTADVIPAGTTVIRPMTDTDLGTFAARAASWKKTLKTGDRATDPKYMSNLLTSVEDWNNGGIPMLKGLTSCPVLSPDGDMLTVPGYDSGTGLYATFSWGVFPTIRDSQCTFEAAQAAMALLEEAIAEFTFADGEDNPKGSNRAVALAAMLTVVIRASLDGAPLFGFTAPTPGTGKTALSNIIAIMATGAPAAAVDYAADDGEFKKILFALILRGPQVVLIDNVVGNFNNSMLNSALTSSVVEGRILGETKTMNVSTKTMWLVNGNNLTIVGDMTRRALLAELDSKCERPAERRFQRRNLNQWTMAHRPQLVAAAMTVLRAYQLAGLPGSDELSPWNDYSDWSDLVRGSLKWLGYADPLDTQRNIDARSPKLAAEKAIFSNWYAVFGHIPISARCMLEILCPGPSGTAFPAGVDPEAATAMLDAFAMLATRTRNGILNPRGVGEVLSSLKDRTIGDNTLIGKPNRKGVNEWTLIPSRSV